MDFKKLLESLNIQTRIAPCELEIDFSKVSEDNEEQFKKEFVALAEQKQGVLNQWLNKLKSKNRMQDTDEVLLELLIEIYKKIDRLEQILDQKAKTYLPLESRAMISHIGHSVLCMSQPTFDEQQDYYLRLFLPIFPQRYVGLFGLALHPQVIRIEHIHTNDAGDFDSLVAERERLMILDSKSLR